MFVTRAWPPPLACADRNELIARVNLATTSSYNASQLATAAQVLEFLSSPTCQQAVV